MVITMKEFSDHFSRPSNSLSKIDVVEEYEHVLSKIDVVLSFTVEVSITLSITLSDHVRNLDK